MYCRETSRDVGRQVNRDQLLIVSGSVLGNVDRLKCKQVRR